MAPPKVPYNPADLGAPNTLLPEEVFGHVDLATLSDIHRFLRESELQDDIELATWVQENYLHGHSEDQSTAIIRTAQGFGQLDRAFRRVRSLTNKAQDKWPFFDRNFKQMSSTTVRNNARGEAAPGVMYSNDGTQEIPKAAGQQHISTSNGLGTPKVSPVPQLQVPFGPLKPSRYQAYKKQLPSPARRARVSPPSELQPKLAQERDPNEESQKHEATAPEELLDPKELSSTPNGQAVNEPEAPQPDAPQVEEMPGAGSEAAQQSPLSKPLDVPLSLDTGYVLSKKPEVGSVRGAGQGKVRGPNGRYLPSNDVPAATKKTKKANKPKKGGRKPGFKAAEKKEPITSKAAPEESGFEATEESVFTNIPSSSPLTAVEETKGNDGIVVQGTDTTTSHATDDKEQQAETGPASDSGISAAYLLAAEADAVPSNLDRLPPSSRKAAKRKSEPTAPSSTRKRGKYGGIVGRPRRTDQPKLPQKEPEVEEEPERQMQTRQNTRHSATANLEVTEPTVSAPETSAISTPKVSTEVPAQKDDVVMGGVEECTYTTAGREPKSGASEVPAAPSPAPSSTNILSPLTTNINLLGMGLMNTSPPTPQQSATSSAPPAPAVASGEETARPPGHVELIARITTSNGTMELPISEEQIDSDEAKMIKKYAEWNATESAVPVPYDQFRKIFSFAKES